MWLFFHKTFFALIPSSLRLHYAQGFYHRLSTYLAINYLPFIVKLSLSIFFIGFCFNFPNLL